MAGLESQLAAKPRVNAPYFEEDMPYTEMAIFWFGRVSTGANAVDVRVGYNQKGLTVDLLVMDRRLWYDPSPSPGDLTAWDSATLYIDTDGDTGSLPDAHSYRFDAQLSYWEDRAPYQAAYQGNDSGWSATSAPFGVWTTWRGDKPNNEIDDRGWFLGFDIPFSGLGVSEPPPGTVWGMGLALHDRDDSGGPPLADQVWPSTLASQQPVTWGQLFFGTPTYSPPAAPPGGTVTIRHGLNGATVRDADVGGSSDCAQAVWPDFFPTWGNLNYAGKRWFNIQNQTDAFDWPCFSKYYVTFPLDALPAGATITSATLVLHHFGGAGEGVDDPAPQPSLIQVLTVGEDWNESTLTWNNAPLALENVAAAWVDPLKPPTPPPGVPRQWDVSRAVAQAYTAGQPLRLVLYAADSEYNSGKYFHTSDVGEYWQEGRPTLIVTWGHSLIMTASPTAGEQGTPITYTIRFVGTGNTLTLTDILPTGVTSPGNFALEGTSIVPSYDSAQRRLTWSGTPPAGQAVTIRYVVSIVASDRRALLNTVNLVDARGTSTASAMVLANPEASFLPLILR